MKVWITRNSAINIQFGGLERLQIWFVKPVFLMQVLDEKKKDTPFGFIGDDQGMYAKFGWYANHKFMVNQLSVGNWLGYGDGEHAEITNFIWSKLKEHFLNEPFDIWHDLEKEGKVKQQDFLLEMEINITLKT